ncbi:MAG: DUF4890 domain-containing protein [Rikenellaceae bacterium]
MFCCAAAVAQPQRQGAPQRGGGMKSADPVEIAEKQTEMLAKQLGLSESQKKSLYALNLKSAEAKKSKMEQSKLAKENEAKRRKEQATKREEYKVAVMKLLNDKQKIGYAEMVGKMDGARGGAQQGGKPQMAGGKLQGGKPQMAGGKDCPTAQGGKPQMQGKQMRPGAAPEGAPQMAPQGAPQMAPQGAPQMAQKGAPQGAPQRGGKRGEGAPKREEAANIDPVEAAQKLVDKMKEMLELSSSQQKKILTLTVVQTTAMRDEMEVRKLEQQAREADRKEVKAQREQYNLDVMALLNEEQKIEYAEMLSKQGQQGGAPKGGAMQQGGNRGGNGAPRPQQGKRPAAN